MKTAYITIKACDSMQQNVQKSPKKVKYYDMQKSYIPTYYYKLHQLVVLTVLILMHSNPNRNKLYPIFSYHLCCCLLLLPIISDVCLRRCFLYSCS